MMFRKFGIAERRAIADSVEQGVRVRPKRNATHLPDSYDDVESARTRSWKKYRRTQYHLK